MIPVLLIVFHWPINLAVGAMVVSLFPAAAISSYFNARKGRIDYRVAASLEIPSSLGAVAGASLIAILPVVTLEVIFSIVLTGLGIYMLKEKSEKVSRESFLFRINQLKPGMIMANRRQDVAYRVSFTLAAIFGATAGLLSGMFGIGGGFIKTPIMIRIFRIPVQVAAATALFTIVFTSAISSVTHYIYGNVDWERAVPVMVGFIGGALVAKFSNLRLSNLLIERLVAGGLLAAGLATAINAISISEF